MIEIAQLKRYACLQSGLLSVSSHGIAVHAGFLNMLYAVLPSVAETLSEVTE